MTTAMFGACVASADSLPGTADNPAIVVSFTATAVTATGITHGGQAVVYAVALDPQGYDVRIVRVAKVVDDDNNGLITLDLGRGVPPRSIFVVADLTDGRYTVAAPGGLPHVVSMPRSAFRRSVEGGGVNVDGFAFDHPVLDVLYVHPGHSAWIWSARDGGKQDHDGANGRTLIAAGEGHRLPGIRNNDPENLEGGHATEFVQGGTLIAIDWYKMQVATAHLDHSLLVGGQ